MLSLAWSCERHGVVVLGTRATRGSNVMIVGFPGSSNHGTFSTDECLAGRGTSELPDEPTQQSGYKEYSPPLGLAIREVVLGHVVSCGSGFRVN